MVGDRRRVLIMPHHCCLSPQRWSLYLITLSSLTEKSLAPHPSPHGPISQLSLSRCYRLIGVPLLVQEGWTRHQTVRKARTGWSVQDDHPVCAFKGRFAAFFDAQPPLLYQ